VINFCIEFEERIHQFGLDSEEVKTSISRADTLLAYFSAKFQFPNNYEQAI
jgi:hypothetical protein